MKDIKQVSTEFDLKVPFIRKCLHTIELLQPHIHKGDKNKVLLDDNGVRIFDKIKEFKTQGLSLPDIKTQLDTPMQTASQTTQAYAGKDMQDTVKTESKQRQTPGQTELITHYETELNALRKEREQLNHERKELEHRLQDVIIKAESLSGELKALPEGKSPEELRKEYQEDRHKKQEAAYILGELKHSTGLLQGRKRKALIARLESLLMEKTEYHEK